MRALLAVLLTVSFAPAAETYIVAAGVDTYDDAHISPLHFATADVEAVAEAFQAAGVPAQHITVLTTDNTDRRKLPTGANILRALGAVREVAVAGDTVIVLFSGHGLTKDGDSWLLTSETDPADLPRTALPLAAVSRRLAGLEASHVLYIIDACRTTPESGRGSENAVLSDAFAKEMRAKLLAPTGRAVTADLLLACDVGQRAWEMPGQGHGAFTWYLLQGLQGAAKSADGAVHLQPLAEYVRTQVPAWAKRAQQEQTPRFENPSGGDFVVVRPGEAPGKVRELATTVTIEITTDPPGATVEVDGVVVGRTPLHQTLDRLNAKKKIAKVVVTLAGYLPKAAEVELKPGGRAEWLVGALTKLDTPAPQPTPAVAPIPAPAPTPPGAPVFRLPDYLAKWQNQMPQGLQYRLRAIDGMPQVLIPAGEFLMGSPAGVGEANEHPQKRVFVSAFWMDLHDVTVAQCRKFCAALHQEWPAKEPAEGWHDHSPMVLVHWNVAQAYAKWAGGALPTEAQWERAARGGLAGKLYPWGDESPVGRAQFDRPTLAPVGSFAPNGYGLFDMAGNVYQWCQDYYDEAWYARMPARDPLNASRAPQRVIRCGGSNSKVPLHLRVSLREGHLQAATFERLGFRLVTAPPPPKRVDPPPAASSSGY